MIDIVGPTVARSVPDLASYDTILMSLSGGKDSIVALDAVLTAGADPNRIELHHHDVDGGAARPMDWPVTAGYCRALAASFGLPLFTSWKEGGFREEMLRENAPTARIHYKSRPAPASRVARGQRTRAFVFHRCLPTSASDGARPT
jgi:tRNA(Ile)-lysidine synthase TilS/MesJ